MKRFSIYLSAFLLLVGCDSKIEDFSDIAWNEKHGNTISTKVINNSRDAVEGMIMVQADGEGKFDFSSLSLPALNITAIEPAFNVTDSNREKLAALGLDNWYVLRFDAETSLDNAARSLSECSNISKIQFNKRLRHHGSKTASAQPLSTGLQPVTEVNFNDPYLVNQWHFINKGNTSIAPTVRAGADINVKDAWGLTAGNPEVIVAVLDRAVQYDHPDLAANMWRNEAELNGLAGVDDDGNGLVDDIHGYNFVSDGALVWEVEGDEDYHSYSSHGTHVAGTIAAVNNNGIGVCGIAGGSGNDDGVRIMSCQVFEGADRGGDGLTMARALIYAADMGAAIAQGSFGYDSGYYTSDGEFILYSYLEAYSLEYFMINGGGSVLDGGMAIFASGNNGEAMASYPGAYAECICVTAIGPDYLPTSYTNFGPGSNIAAPGGDSSLGTSYATMVYSTAPGNTYEYQEGTSMACPHVTGVAALGLSYAKQLGKKYNRADFTNLLLTSVSDIDTQLDREKEGMNLYEYRGKMGTGVVDAWRLLMNIEGTPSLIAPVGQTAYLDLSPYMGGSATAYLNYSKVEISINNKAMAALGIEQKPVFEYGKLKVNCSKAGSAKIKITFTIDEKASGDTKKISREFSIISKGVATSNGGWL